MMTKSLILSGILSLSLGTVAVAGTNFHPAPSAANVVTGHEKQVRKLMAETRAAHAAIRRGEPRAAADLVRDAIKLEVGIAGSRRYALVGSASGTFEQVSTTKGAPVVTKYDHFSDKELLDLKATRRDLVNAKTALAAGKLNEAEQSLAKISRAFIDEEQITPDRAKRAEQNVGLAVHEMGAGQWSAAKVEIDAANKDVSKSPSAKPTTAPKR